MSNTDEYLLLALRAEPRDERLWSYFYRRLQPQVYVLTFRLCSANSDLAQELTQDAFVRFISASAIRKVDNQAAAVAYLRAIVRNLVRDHYRRRAEHPMISTDALPVDDLERALNAVVRRTMEPADMAVLNDMPAADRELLHLILQGNTVGEIAEMLQLTYSATAVRIHRLRKQLRETCKESLPLAVQVSKRGVP